MSNYTGGKKKNTGAVVYKEPDWPGEIKIRKSYYLTEFTIDTIEALGGSEYLETLARKLQSISIQENEDCF